MKLEETINFGSINPEEMTNSEIREMCGYLYTAKNWRQSHIVVNVNGISTSVSVSDLPKYQKAYKTETGQIKV